MEGEAWLETIVSIFGEPRVRPPDPKSYTGRYKVTEHGIYLHGGEGELSRYRRSWVWFPEVEGELKNHHFHIDRYDDHWKIGAGSHVPWKPTVDLRTKERPTDRQIFNVLNLAKFLWLKMDHETQIRVRMLGRPTLLKQEWSDT